MLLKKRPSFWWHFFHGVFIQKPQGWMSLSGVPYSKWPTQQVPFFVPWFSGVPTGTGALHLKHICIFVYHIGCTCLSCLKHLGHLLNQSFTLWSYRKAYHWLVRNTIVSSESIATWVWGDGPIHFCLTGLFVLPVVLGGDICTFFQVDWCTKVTWVLDLKLRIAAVYIRNLGVSLSNDLPVVICMNCKHLQTAHLLSLQNVDFGWLKKFCREWNS